MAPKKNYSEEQMQKAIDCVKKGGKISHAAQKYGVPRITLHNKITGKSPLVCSMGPSTHLTKEEEHILETWILQMYDNHIPVTKDDLLDSVQRIITDKGIETPFAHNRPGKKWYSLFLKRHPLISERTAQNLTAARENVSEEDIRKWFKEIETYLREKNLLTVLEHPERVFNTDESAFYLAPKAGKVLAKKGEKHVYSSSGDDKENLTVLVTGNAAGQLAPTMVVFSYERVPSAISNNFPSDWAIGRSESGWMCGSTFFEYIANFFNPWLDKNNIERPVLFFLDGHKSHLTLHLSDFCVANGIEIIALNPNSTHLMQPMDLAVFRPLKSSWRKAVNSWKLQNIGQTLKKEHFAPVLKTALNTLTTDSIKSGFRAGGLYPFGPDYIDMSKIKLSQRQNSEEDAAKTDFFSYLESEISTVFRPQKLEQFRQHFFTDKDNLEVPEQDLSLYLIWAKNYVPCPTPQLSNIYTQSTAPQASTVQSHTETTAENEFYPDITINSVPSEDPITAEPVTAFPETTTNPVPSEDPIAAEPVTAFPETTTNPVPSEDPITAEPVTAFPETTTNPVPSESKIVTRNETEPGPSVITLDNINSDMTVVGTNSSEYQVLSGDPVTAYSETSILDVSRNENLSSTSNPQPGTSRGSINNTACLQTDTEEIKRHEATPVKKVIKGGVVIPSPFKRHIFWPDENEYNKKKRKLKEKIPFAITSPAWRTYHLNKEKEKQRKLIEKEKRAEERIQRKKKKEELKNKKNKKKAKKQVNLPISSDDTDTEVKYAESDESVYEEETNESLNEPLSDGTNTKDLPESKKIRGTSRSAASLGSKIEKGCYVIIKYEGEYFPGVVEDIDKSNYKVSTMTFSASETYRWPNKPDSIWYEEKDIVEKIEEPVMINRRGYYEIKEMKKFHTFTT